MRKIALFDFDGTLYMGDSFLRFCRKSKKNYFFGLLILSPFILWYYLKLTDAKSLKNRFLAYYFKSYSKVDFNALAQQFSETLDERKKEDIWEKLEVLKRNEFEICIVSASIDSYLQPWSDAHGFALLCTKIDWENGPIVEGENCNYNEKVARIKQQYNLEGYDKILAFGDSNGDEAMLSLQRV